MMNLIRAFVVCVVWPLLIAASALAALVLIGVSSVEWEIQSRQAVGAHLDQLSAAIAATPTDGAAYSELARATTANRGWDRVAAFAEIKTCGHLILCTPGSHALFTTHLLPALRQGLVADDAYVREQAARAACEYAQLVAPLRGTLMQVAQQYPNQGCGWFSVRAIGSIGPQAADMIDVLNSLAAHNDSMNEEAESAVKNLQIGQQSMSPRPSVEDVVSTIRSSADVESHLAEQE